MKRVVKGSIVCCMVGFVKLNSQAISEQSRIVLSLNRSGIAGKVGRATTGFERLHQRRPSAGRIGRFARH